MKTIFYIIFVLSSIPLGYITAQVYNKCRFNYDCINGCQNISPKQCKSFGADPFLIQTGINTYEWFCFGNYNSIPCELLREEIY